MPKTLSPKNKTFLSSMIVEKGRGVVELSEAIAPQFGICGQSIYQRIIGKTPASLEEMQRLTDAVCTELHIEPITQENRQYQAILVKAI